MSWLAAASMAAASVAARTPVLLWSWLHGGSLPFPAMWRMTGAAFMAHLRVSLCVAFLAAVFGASGLAVRRALSLEATSRLEAAATAYALGCVLWGTLFLLLGLAGLLRPAVLHGCLGAGALFAAWELRRRRPDASALRAELAESGGLWLTLLGLQLAVLLPYALVPETFYDSLEYHLGLPHLYLLRGLIGSVPDNAFSGVPSVPSMLYGWALVLDKAGVAAHLLSWLFLPACCAAILALGRRFGAPRAGGLAAAAFAMSPCVSSAAHMTGVELPWAFFQLAAFVAALDAAERPDLAAPWLAAGLLAGGAMATKYLAWALPAALLPAVWSAEGRPPRRGVLLAAGAALLVLAPWLARNLADYANPVYPFFQERLHPGSAVMPGWRYLGSGATLPWGAGFAAAATDWLKAPWAMLDFGGKWSDSAGAVLLGMVPFGLWAATRDRAWRPLLWFTLLCWLPLSLATVLPRYFIPVFLPLSLIAALAVEGASAQWGLRPFAALLLLSGAFVDWYWGLPTSRLPVFTGQAPVERFLSHADIAYYPAPLYPAARWLGGHSPPDARVLIVGDTRGFQVPRDQVISTPMQTTVLERWADASADGAALRERFRANGVTYILVNHAEIVRRRMEFDFTRRGLRSLDGFWRRWTLKVFQAGPDVSRVSNGTKLLDRWVIVYRVLSDEEAARPHPSDDLFSGYDVR